MDHPPPGDQRLPSWVRAENLQYFDHQGWVMSTLEKRYSSDLYRPAAGTGGATALASHAWREVRRAPSDGDRQRHLIPRAHRWSWRQLPIDFPPWGPSTGTSRVLPRSLPSSRTFVERPPDCGLAEIEADHLVVGLLRQLVEDPRIRPIVTSCPQCRMRYRVAGQALRVFPRAPDRESDHDPLEADPLWTPITVTAQRVGLERLRDEWLDGCPDSVFHFGIKCAHDGGDLRLVVGFGFQPRFARGHHKDR